MQQSMPHLLGRSTEIAHIKFNNSGFSLHDMALESEPLCFDVINTDYQSYIIKFNKDDDLAGYEQLVDLLPYDTDECLIKKIATFSVSGKNYARYIVIAKDLLLNFNSMAAKLGLGIHNHYDIWSYFLKNIPIIVDRAGYFIEVNNVVYQFEISDGKIIDHKILPNNIIEFYSEAPVWFCCVREEFKSKLELAAKDNKIDLKIIDELLPIPIANYLQCGNCAFLSMFFSLFAISIFSYLFYLILTFSDGKENHSLDEIVKTVLNTNLSMPENSYISKIEASSNNILLRGYYSDMNTYSKVTNRFSPGWHLINLGNNLFEAGYA